MSARSCVVSSSVDAALAVELGAGTRARAAFATTSSPIVGSSRKSDLGVVQQRRRRGRRASAGRARAGAPACRGTAPSSSSSAKRSRFARRRSRRDAVDVAQQVERVAQRQVPPELRALAEDDADPAGELDRGCATGSRPGDPEPARRRHEDAGEHLDRRRLAGAVRADVADHLAALDLEAIPSTASTTRRSRRRRPRFARTDEASSRRRRPRSTGSATGAPVVAHGVAPDAPRPRGRRARRRAARRTASASGRPSASVLVEEVERREVGDERERDDEDDEAPQPAREDR